MTINYTKSFRRDYKVVSKRKWDKNKLNIRISKLDKECKGHMLKGNFAGKRECHIGYDWVLVYEVAKGVINLIRMGTHSEVLGV